MKLSGTMIGSEDPKTLGEFYTKLLGEAMWRQDDWYGFRAGSDLMIGPHSDIKGKNSNPGRIMFNFVTEEFDDEFERIKGLGATVIAEPYKPDEANGEMWLATFADPDGNYFQIGTPWDAEQSGSK